MSLLTVHIIGGLLGLVAGVVVNWLADILPPSDIALGADASSDAEVKESGAGELVSRRPAIPSIYLLIKSLWPTHSAAMATALPWRFPIVEVGALGIGWGLVAREGLTAGFGVLFGYSVIFLLISVIDVEHRLVLNAVMLPAFVGALMEVVLGGRFEGAIADALAGYAVAQIVVLGFYLMGFVYLWLINTNRDQPVEEVAFGFGDVTLATFCGLVLGIPDVFLMLVLMVLIGGVVALAYLLIRLVLGQRYEAHTPLPYGPSICLAASLMLIFPEQIYRILLGG